MFDELLEFLKSILPATDYEYSRGMYIDSKEIEKKKIVSILATPGAPVDVDDRRPRFRVIILGARNTRKDAAIVYAAAQSIVSAVIDGGRPCGSAGVRIMSEPTDGGFTTENRAFTMLDLQLTL